MSQEIINELLAKITRIGNADYANPSEDHEKKLENLHGSCSKLFKKSPCWFYELFKSPVMTCNFVFSYLDASVSNAETSLFPIEQDARNFELLKQLIITLQEEYKDVFQLSSRLVKLSYIIKNKKLTLSREQYAEILGQYVFVLLYCLQEKVNGFDGVCMQIAEEFIKELESSEVNLLNKNETLLHVALSARQKKSNDAVTIKIYDFIIFLLLEKKAKIDLKNNRGETQLMLAASPRIDIAALKKMLSEVITGQDLESALLYSLTENNEHPSMFLKVAQQFQQLLPSFVSTYRADLPSLNDEHGYKILILIQKLCQQPDWNKFFYLKKNKEIPINRLVFYFNCLGERLSLIFTDLESNNIATDNDKNRFKQLVTEALKIYITQQPEFNDVLSFLANNQKLCQDLHESWGKNDNPLGISLFENGKVEIVTAMSDAIKNKNMHFFIIVFKSVFKNHLSEENQNLLCQSILEMKASREEMKDLSHYLKGYVDSFGVISSALDPIKAKSKRKELYYNLENGFEKLERKNATRGFKQSLEV